MKKISKIGQHLIFWISLPTLIVLFNWANQKSTSMPGFPKPDVHTFLEVFVGDVPEIVILLFYSIPIFYISYYLLTPKLIFKKKLFNYFLFVVALFVYAFLIEYLFIKLTPMFFFFGTPYVFKILYPIIFLSGLAGSFYVSSEKLQKDRADKLILENQNYKLELDALKSTIRPHFLFNTLNNIDILITKDSEKASEYLKKLSDILRFMLYDTRSDLIPLKLELEYINKYIELQRIRTSNNEYVRLEIKGTTEDWKIAPMLYIPFVENAFKYSSNKKVKDAIKISFDVTSNEVSFYCLNCVSDQTNNKEESGLGIRLIEQRLKLLYKENFDLEIKEVDEIHSVKLTIRK